jgi:hypothetical protein
MRILSKHDSNQRDQLEMITLDQLVPANHLVRKIESAIDFTFIYDLVKDIYSETGSPSINPVILAKLTFIDLPSVFVQCIKQLKKLKQIWLTVGS